MCLRNPTRFPKRLRRLGAMSGHSAPRRDVFFRRDWKASTPGVLAKGSHLSRPIAYGFDPWLP